MSTLECREFVQSAEYQDLGRYAYSALMPGPTKSLRRHWGRRLRYLFVPEDSTCRFKIANFGVRLKGPIAWGHLKGILWAAVSILTGILIANMF